MDIEKIFSSRTHTRLVKYFLENPSKVFNQAGLARMMNCSPSTVARLLTPLVKEGLILYEQISGQMKVVALNVESPRVQMLLDFYTKAKAL